MNAVDLLEDGYSFSNKVEVSFKFKSLPLSTSHEWFLLTIMGSFLPIFIGLLGEGHKFVIIIINL